MAERRSPCYRLGEFVLESDEHRLTRAGEEIPLRPKSFEVLLYLVEHHGHLVSKEELLDAIWPDAYVSEGTLRQIVWEIREALGEHKDQQRLIKTIPKIGYQFVGEVHESQPENSPSRAGNLRPMLLITAGILMAAGILLPIFIWLWPESPQPEAGNPVIAVLPFENLSPNPEDEYFSRGTTEEISTSLSKLEDLRVVSLTSLINNEDPDKELKKIVEELGVTAVVEGNARYAEGRVRISARLTDAKTGEQLWAESYDQERVKIFEIQDNVARSIATALKGRLDKLEGYPLDNISPERVEAHDLVLRARYFMSRWNRDQATTCYERAITTDPSYAVPYAEVAANYVIDAAWDSPGEQQTQRWSQAEEAIKKAFKLDDSSAEAHYALAMLREHRFDWAGAEQSFKKAIDLNPNHRLSFTGYAVLLTRLGRYEEALKFAELAHQLEPFILSTNRILVWMYLNTERFDKALELAQELMELHPARVEGYVTLAGVYRRMESFDQAFEVLDEAREKLDIGKTSPWSTRAWHISVLGNLYALTGADAEAQDCLKRLGEIARDNPIPGIYWYMASVHMALGEQEKALDCLEKSGFWIVGGEYSKIVSQDPIWDPLRTKPRFQALIQKLNLPEDAIRKPGLE